MEMLDFTKISNKRKLCCNSQTYYGWKFFIKKKKTRATVVELF